MIAYILPLYAKLTDEILLSKRKYSPIAEFGTCCCSVIKYTKARLLIINTHILNCRTSSMCMNVFKLIKGSSLKKLNKHNGRLSHTISAELLMVVVVQTVDVSILKGNNFSQKKEKETDPQTYLPTVYFST